MGEGKREGRFLETCVNQGTRVGYKVQGLGSRRTGKWIWMHVVWADRYKEKKMPHNSHQTNMSSTHIYLQTNPNMAIGLP